MNIKPQAMWPTLFHVATFPEPQAVKATLVELCYQLREREPAWGIAARSKQGLYESQPRFFDHAAAEPLLAFCNAVVATVFQRVPRFVESWCHITNGGGYHDAHAHVDFARGVCGIYYLQAGDCRAEPVNGVNRFYSPNLFDQNEVADIVPEEGKLILFPGHVRHAALPYTGGLDRIVISFNALFEHR